jgi:hypothetical protein
MQSYLMHEVARDHQSALIRQAERERMASRAGRRDSEGYLSRLIARLPRRVSRRSRVEPGLAGV